MRSVKCGIWSEESATPATQNDIITCLEIFEENIFSNFPHRHSDAIGKPETRYVGVKKTSILCETFSKLDIFGTLLNRLEC